MHRFKFEYQKTSLIKDSVINDLLEKLHPEIQKIKNEFNNKYDSRYAFSYVPFDEKNLNKVKYVIKEKQELRPTALVVIGIGGSNLGTWAVHEAINGKLYPFDLLPLAQDEHRLKVYFADTVDSDYIFTILNLIEQELKANNNVIINIVSKSGTTVETTTIGEFFIALLKKYKPNNFNDFIVVTTDLNSQLYKQARDIKSTILEIPKKLGGRYSVFSAVGLLPLGLLGINLEDLLQGARDISIANAAISSAILYQHYKNGINIHDTFLFAVDLEYLGKWYRQLMAESLGKCNMGITPTVSIGSSDLHSMVQLYLGGPRDKFTTFVTLQKNETKFAEIMHAIITGTQIAYQQNERPFCTITLENKSTYSIGQFMQFKMYEIVFLGYLLDVNPFDQLNVESYKVETRKILDI